MLFCAEDWSETLTFDANPPDLSKENAHEQAEPTKLNMLMPCSFAHAPPNTRMIQYSLMYNISLVPSPFL